jgi:hypothetical protein
MYPDFEQVTSNDKARISESQHRPRKTFPLKWIKAELKKLILAISVTGFLSVRNALIVTPSTVLCVCLQTSYDCFKEKQKSHGCVCLRMLSNQGASLVFAFSSKGEKSACRSSREGDNQRKSSTASFPLEYFWQTLSRIPSKSPLHSNVEVLLFAA